MIEYRKELDKLEDLLKQKTEKIKQDAYVEFENMPAGTMQRLITDFDRHISAKNAEIEQLKKRIEELEQEIERLEDLLYDVPDLERE